ncbi:putative proteasome subunit alpha2, protease of the acylase family and NTN hydrolase fold [Cardiosporidium cionae]|uniref:Proteasome subunit alpha2, protease of the acylase family and NTN hydrolase fold n=1 Tax=Cardiosporidium cionae TaxID=476202 RepID=A0ABQ7JG35_9APIC|nr:putative proteasome subunit alpha2, protease of the acylase family and NTN hydrolase fold [Cardiosporidium cionae]|eukprot:KAF8822933.1 putative proteasome subunit alpha2, protease of the acylase family and NTN hydrolase fold [Cardiosporidium cionae]
MGDVEHSFSLTTFSPSGKLIQIEYALNRVQQGAPALSIKALNGVVIATEKKLSTELIDEGSLRKIEPLTPNVGCVCAGMPADFRVIVKRGRKEMSNLLCLQKMCYLTLGEQIVGIIRLYLLDKGWLMGRAYLVSTVRSVLYCLVIFSYSQGFVGHVQAMAYHLLYGEHPPVSEVVKYVAAVMQEFTQSGGVRPFGISLLVAGYDAGGPQLYQVDPSGAYFGWRASAIGRDMQNSKTFLEKRYNPEFELEDAIHTAILTLKEGFEGAITEHNIEIGVVGVDKIFKVLSPSEIKDYLEEVE